MRPLRLKLKNFTAFRDEQEIDFTDLDLFALWGPIGSGKSSILDAMTYALYGYVDRVGNQTSQLVSQGQPRMAVQLDFRVGDIEARVSRSTLATGNSKVLLEKRVNGDFQSYGEGADQVRTVNKTILDLVGLDYDAFTRSVVLPQGKFAQFLVGDPAKRREILTELLGLELFERMAKRSNEIATEAKISADAAESMLERGFADVSDAKVAEMRAEAAAASRRALETERVAEELRVIGDRAGALNVAIEGVEASRRAIGDLSSELTDYTLALKALVAQLDAANDDIATARLEVEKADDTVERVVTDLNKARDLWGSRDDLVALREQIARLAGATAEADATGIALTDAVRRAEKANAVVDAADKALASAKKKCKLTGRGLAGKKQVHEKAHRHDLVGTLVAGLEAGAPCPVCDRPLKAVPQIDVSALEAAFADLEMAEKEHKHSERQLAEAEKAHAVAAATMETSMAEKTRCGAEHTGRTQAVEKLRWNVARAFKNDMPADPLHEVERRIAEMDDLIVGHNDAELRQRAALDALRDQDTAIASARSEVDKVCIAIEHLRIAPAVADARRAAPDAAVGEALSRPAPDDHAEFETHAGAVTAALNELEHALSGHEERLVEQLSRLKEDALDLLPGDTRNAQTIDQAIGSIEQHLRRTRDEATRLETTAEKLEGDLARKVELQVEIAAKREEHGLYRTLGLELRRDRIVDYLQAEALIALAGFASDRLHELSGGRYRLSFENEGFYVVDGWNGEERRRVSTLSGGETFLASLALALALSEQVQMLAVTERQQLESLFLDEGFGSLDAETLEVVIAAIEQLGGEDRLVGVITHVTEVADRLPVRIEVEKSPRGSRLMHRPPT
jgi:exonuclease SbcC